MVRIEREEKKANRHKKKLDTSKNEKVQNNRTIMIHNKYRI